MSIDGKRILVLGGTGLLGGAVARALVRDGFPVRVMTRESEGARTRIGADVELVEGDVGDRGSLRRAMQDCAGVHISVGGPVDQLSAENVCSLVPGSGVERVTYVSGATVCEENAWFPMVAQKLAAERAVRDCGIPYMIFCPTWPMEMLTRFARGGRPVKIGRQATPIHWYAADELGRMVARAYRADAASGKRFYVHGPEGIPMGEALVRYCAHFHPRGPKLSSMPIWAAKLVAALTRNAVLAYAARLMDYFDRVGEMGDPTEANAALGAPTMRLGDWMASFEAAAARGTR